jgi:hypothetical protein
MQKEQTIILSPVDKTRIFEVKETIIQEAIERNIQNSTIITANLIRNTVSVTSKDDTFIRDLSRSKEFTVIQVVTPFLN